MKKTPFISLLLLCALVALPTALAVAAPPGKYKGKLYSADKSDRTPYKNVKVTLKVAKSGKKLMKFTVDIAPVYCVRDPFDPFSPSNGLELQTIYVPAAKIKPSGRFKKVYKVMDDGQEIGRNTLKGRFKGKRASGTIETQGSGCSGKFRFKVKRR